MDLSFPDATYSSANKPSVDTLKSDLTLIEQGVNALLPATRVITAADDATAIIDVDSTDQYQLTAIANATTISTTGTPLAGQKLTIRLKDAGVAKTLTWDAIFRAVSTTLPTATTASKTTYIGCIYNATDTKWDVLAVAIEA
jgi:hypothetical protein